MLEALSPQRRRFVLACWAVAALVVVGVVVRVAGAQTVVRPVPQDRLGPVLLVPGYGGDVTALASIADALRSSGRAVEVLEPDDGGTGDLDAQAERLADEAERVRRDAAAPSVDVVGYSAGGVVARLWVRDHGGGSVARRVLTLGSPHHGTTAAALGRELAGGCPTACEQLVPGSDLLRGLNAGDETPAGPVWATIRTTSDDVVTPSVSAALDGALDLVVQDACPGTAVTHGQLPSHPLVLAALASVLDSEPPAAPVDPGC